jgi:hypothetical protein
MVVMNDPPASGGQVLNDWVILHDTMKNQSFFLARTEIHASATLGVSSAWMFVSSREHWLWHAHDLLKSPECIVK